MVKLGLKELIICWFTSTEVIKHFLGVCCITAVYFSLWHIGMAHQESENKRMQEFCRKVNSND